ncbi:RDD family protein [Parasulfitobacter algicola]|uniref:RDD family protein n=1 Tax=Parasulfitobacter algicola TaxID=2614809 RepID=A0ABX2IK87_9RHOB|nr:RDD family protein [Sulfitobacter algicola]NSX53296.1 RDD family protein [Sulfitobacter algicola]
MTQKARTKRVVRKSNLRLIEDFMPPEGVPITFETAGLGVRLGAQILDILITFLFVIAIVIMLAIVDLSRGETVMAVGSLLFFFIRIPYYILTELFWNGETLGKRMLKIKVVSADGRSLTPHAVVVRNLTKEAEVFLPIALMFTMPGMDGWGVLASLAWIGACLIGPFFSKKRQRLGDFIAGTYVIHKPVARLLPDLSRATTVQHAERFAFMPHQMDHYGAYELQTLETLLQRDTSKTVTYETRRRNEETMDAIVTRIRRKIDYSDPIEKKDHRDFLKAFYAAQRAHLEQRQLFGDKRDDKYQLAERNKNNGA